MKPFYITAFFCALLFSASPSWGQIKDDEDSYNLLAAQCLISARQAGRNDVTLADYDQYANSLAKVLSVLSPEQQYRVFGSVSGESASAEIEPVEKASSLKAESASSGRLSDMGNAIVDSIGNLNAFMSGENGAAPALLVTVGEPDVAAGFSDSEEEVLAAADSALEPEVGAISAVAAETPSVSAVSVVEEEPVYASSSANSSAPFTPEAKVVGETTVDAASALVEAVEETSEKGQFNFWAALKKFFEGVLDYFNGDGSNQYEEYAGS